jgi:hypothetical protein
LKSAIAGINASLDKMAKASAAAGVSSANTRIGAEKKVLSEVDKSAKAQEKALTDSIKRSEKSFTTSEKEKTKVARSEAAQRAKDTQKYIADTRAINDHDAREFEKAEQQKTRIAKAEAAKRNATINSIAGGAGNLVGGAVRGTARVLGRAALTLAMGGGFLVADAVHKRIAEEEQVGTSVRAAAYKGGLGEKEYDAAGRAAAISVGGTAEKSFEGMDAVIRQTGDLPAAIHLVKDLAKYSAATGAEMADLGSVAGITFTHMGGDIGKTNDVMLRLVNQTRKGAIDMRDLGQYGGRLVAAADLFEGTAGGNIETFGALAQIAKRRGGKVTAAEATEGSARLFDEIERHQKAFDKLGVTTKGEGGKLAPVQNILLDTLVRQGVTKQGDVLSLIPKLFGRQAGGVEVGLAASFLEGSGGRGDAASLAAGKAHALADIDQYRTKDIGAIKAEIDENVASKLLETQAKLNVAMETFRQRIGDQLLPLMPGLIQKFTELIPAIQHVIEFFTNGSLTAGLAKVVGVIFAAELLKGAVTMGATLLSTAAIIKSMTAALGLKAAVTSGVAAVEEVAVGAGAAAEAGLLGVAGLTAGIVGFAGLGVAGVAGGMYYANKRGEQGNELVQKAMQMPEGTAEEKAAKYAILSPMLERAEHQIVLGKEGRGEMGMAGMDAYNADKSKGDYQAMGMTQSLSGMKDQVDRLTRSLGSAADEAAGFKLPADLNAAIVHPPGPGGPWKDNGASRDND